MVAIPSGQFMMGDRHIGYDGHRPLHRESVAEFALGRYEVTFDEWNACVRGGGCVSNPNPNDQGWGRGRRPVINVSLNDVQEYLQWLSARTGQAYRLPSEVEWAYADNEPRNADPFRVRPGRFAASYDLRESPEAQGTVAVGSFEPNYFGLHDKIGNVSELTANKFPPNEYDSAEYAVVSGLNWNDHDPHGSGFMGSMRVDHGNEWVGFRVARSLTGVRNPNPLPTPLSGPLEPPLENGYYAFGGATSQGFSINCGAYESAVTLTRDVALRASRDLAAPVIATVRGGESVNIIDCRVHLRPRRGDVLRTDYGFEAGRPVYFLYENIWEFEDEYFEHDGVVQFVWHQGEIIEVPYGFPEDMFGWEPATSVESRNGGGGGCWYQLDARGLRGWAQSADIDCYWSRRSDAAE